MIADVHEFIQSIIQELSLLMETVGVQRAIHCTNIVQMLNTLNDGILKQEECYESDKKILQDQIDQLNKQLLGNGEEIVSGETVYYDFDPRKKGELPNGT